MERKSVLIIDDHPLICDAYVQALHKVVKDPLSLKIQTAGNCDHAYDMIKRTPAHAGWDLVFLDMRLPPSVGGEILSGQDLGEAIRQKFLQTPILVCTTYNDNFKIQDIFNSLNPEGFLIKNDIDPNDIVQAVISIFSGGVFYSHTVASLMRKRMFQATRVDKWDRRILYELSIGTKMKDMPKVIPLSLAAIEKRKRSLKEMFNVEDKTDRELVLIAIEKGYI